MSRPRIFSDIDTPATRCAPSARMSRQDAGSSTTPCGPSSGESQRIGDVESDSPYQTTPKKPTITADGQVVGFELPKDFSIRHVDGRYSLVRSYCPRKGQEMWNRVVCRSLIWVDAELEAENQGEFLLRICFRDGANESGVSDVVVPCSYLDSKQKLAKSLIGAGVRLLPENCAKADMAEYLSGLQVMNQHLIPRGNACSQFGWNEHKTGFLLGRVRIGEDADYFWSKNTKDHNRADQLRTQGSPEQWRGIAEAMIAEAPVAALALAASLAAPLDRLLGGETISLAFTSRSTTETSTLLRLAASVWGWHGDDWSKPGGMVGSGDTTPIALGDHFEGVRDIPRIWDGLRLRKTNPKNLSALQYGLKSIADGMSRIRCKPDGSMRTTRRGGGSLLIATEMDSRDFLKSVSVARRIMHMPGPYASDPALPLDRHCAGLVANYGHAGRAFVEALVGAAPMQRDIFRATHEKIKEYLCQDMMDSNSEIEQTWSREMALAMTAVDLACELCPKIMPDPVLWSKRLHWCWDQLRKTAKKRDVDESTDSAV